MTFLGLKHLFPPGREVAFFKLIYGTISLNYELLNCTFFGLRVLNPPGGRSSNIFGDVDDTRPASASKKPISNVFGETENSSSSTQGSINKARSQESSKV